MKAKELAAKLLENPDAEVLLCSSEDCNDFANDISRVRFQRATDGGWNAFDAVVLYMDEASYDI